MDRYAAMLERYLPAALPPDWELQRLPDFSVPRWTRFPARWLIEPRRIPWSDFDVVHVLDHSYGHVLHRKPEGVRAVVTVHDLYALDDKRPKSRLRARLLRHVNEWVLRGVSKADVCLCDSNATMQALVHHLPEVRDRSRVEFLGVESHFFVNDRAVQRKRGRRHFDIPEDVPLILHVGSCMPRKNVESVLLATASLRRDWPALRFLQVGGRFTDQQRTLVSTLGINECVSQAPYVSEELLPSVYAAADVVAVPSVFEGFGFPVLEAFAAGVPVAASRNWSLREFPEHLLESLGGGTAQETLEGLRWVLGNPEKCVARAAVARDWARQWTWERVARGAASAYGAP